MNDVYSPCYICKSKKIKKKPAEVRDNANLDVLECADCGLVFLSSFSHINDGFYENSGMHEDEPDIEKWSRETAWDDERRFNALCKDIENKSVLDFGCGNGGFLLMARKRAKQVEGLEPEKSLQSYFKKVKLKISADIAETSKIFDVITLFHVLEHLPDPRAVLVELSKKLNKEGQLIIEVPSADDVLLNLYQSEPFSRFTYWSCHLFLFNQSTLARLGKQAGLSINYVKQIQRYPLSNHLYWLANGKPGGHQKWSFLDSQELHNQYEKQLANFGACDTIFASFSKD